MRRLHKRFKGGQSLAEAAAGVNAFCDQILAKHPGDNILVVAHLHTYQMFDYYLNHKALRAPWLWSKYIPTAQFHEFIPKSGKEPD